MGAGTATGQFQAGISFTLQYSTVLSESDNSMMGSKSTPEIETFSSFVFFDCRAVAPAQARSLLLFDRGPCWSRGNGEETAMTGAPSPWSQKGLPCIIDPSVAASARVEQAVLV